MVDNDNFGSPRFLTKAVLSQAKPVPLPMAMALNVKLSVASACTVPHFFPASAE